MAAVAFVGNGGPMQRSFLRFFMTEQLLNGLQSHFSLDMGSELFLQSSIFTFFVIYVSYGKIIDLLI